MSESDNLPTGGTDTAQPLSIDDAMDLDWTDPGEDNGETEEETQSEAVPGEADAEDSQEADEIEATADEEAEGEDEGETAEAEPAPEPADDVHVTVNGEKLALSALKAGYLRQADYTRKTQELGNKTRDLDALSARVSQSVERIAEYLVKQLPQEPDFALLQTNPTAYMQQKGIYDASVGRLNSVLAQMQDVKEVGNTLTQEQRREQIASENARLAEAFPTTATDEGRRKFFDTASHAARELGYSDEEIKTAVDHRMFALAHYAAIGMKAEKAREKAKVKVQNAPPVAPQKSRQQGVQQTAVRRNQEAMKRLARSGSIEDALLIDFD